MSARHALFLLFPVLVLLPAAMHPEEAPSSQTLSTAARRWVEHTMARLTTDEKIGQIVFPTYFGAFESVESAAFKELMSRVDEEHIGGFILATRRGPRGIELSHVYETAVLTNELQDAAKIPLLIGADFEHGTVMRVAEGTAFPEAMAVGATGRPEDAYAMGRVTAIEARAMGVHWVFAPVADVNSNPDNPIINIRSFGEDPKQVADYVAQFVRGVEENGAMATAKHFPGHGDTSVDSHLELPLVTAGLERLNAVEFVPFEAAIGAGASAVMTGHLAVPALEPNPDTPATLSERVLTGVLRDQLHFQGLVITDALDMGGVTKGFPPGEVAVRALLAGADVLLMSPVTDAAIASVRDAVNSGRVPMARLEDAVRRVLEAKARLGLYKQREVDIDKLSSVFGRPEFLATADDIAARGVTLLRNDAGLVPLDPRTTKRVFLLAVSADPDTAPAEPFEHELRAQLDALESLHVDTKYFRVEETHLPSPDSYDLAICAVTVRTADRKGTVGLPPNEAEMIHALLRAGKPVIMVGLGSPYLMESFPEATTWVAAFSVQGVAQQAAARALLGTFAVSGKIPVSLPGAAPHALRVGDGMTTAAIPLTPQLASAEMEERLKPAFAVIDQAIEAHIFPVATLAVGYKDNLMLKSFGRIPSGAPWPKDAETTTLDVPVITSCVAVLISSGQLALETPVYRVLPQWAAGPDAERHKRVTIRHLLENTSGLATSSVPNTDVFTEVLASEPGQQYRPSESGYLLLQRVVEVLSGDGLPEFANEHIFKRIGRPGAYSLEHRPSRGPSSSKGSDFVTQQSANAADFAALCQWWLNGGIYAHTRLLHRGLVDQLTARKMIDGSAFFTGWLAPSESVGTGRSLSLRAYGYTHEWGDSVWLDPARELFIVFLPFPYKPLEVRDRFNPTRAALHDAIIEALAAPEALK